MARIRIYSEFGGDDRPNPRTNNPLLDNEDLAMRENARELARVENRITRLYTQAGRELQQRLDEYLEQHGYEAMDEEMRGRVERNIITQQEYERWRMNTIMRTTSMQQQIDSLTNDLVNTDRLAVQMVNGELPNVYVSSYNYSGFRGEILADAAGYSYANFSLYNADAMRIIIAEDPDLIPWQPPSVDIPKDRRWNRRHIQDAIAQGILQGDGIREISNRLLPIVNMDRNAATRTARTAFTAVQNEARRDGTRRLREAGIPMVEPWLSLLAKNTRDTHLMLHGTYPNKDGLYGEGILPKGHLMRFPGDPNGLPEQVYNCQCHVNSYLEGIDHSRDKELYAEMMKRDHYEDWSGQRDDGSTVNGVADYKVDEMREALERKRRLDNGEIEASEIRAYNRRMDRQGGSVAAPVEIRTIPDAVRTRYDAFEKKYVDAKVEHSLLVSEDGSVLFQSASRRRESVSIGSESLLEYRGNGAYLIHNHTANELFSVQDIYNNDLYGLHGTITMPNGFEYTLFNTNGSMWQLPEDNRRGMAGAWDFAIKEINDSWLQSRRAYIDELDTLGLSREETRERMRIWDDSHSRLAMQEQWLEQNAEKYGYIFRKRKIM